MTTLQHILQRNAAWAHRRKRGDTGYFVRLAKMQSPELMWIGCSDSRVSANSVCGLEPGEVFVHRNVGNLVYASDLNCMSVLQYAVESLKVRHIVVCGHCGCGGVRAALDGGQPGLIDHWIEPIRSVARENRERLMALPHGRERVNALAEMNIRVQVQNLVNSPIVQQAWARQQALTLHGWIYDLESGLLRDLHCSRGTEAQALDVLSTDAQPLEVQVLEVSH
jgi:carbonic anhydrase